MDVAIRFSRRGLCGDCLSWTGLLSTWSCASAACLGGGINKPVIIIDKLGYQYSGKQYSMKPKHSKTSWRSRRNA